MQGLPGPPGEPQGYDTNALAALLAHTSSMSNTKGPSNIQEDEPVKRIFDDRNFSPDEQRNMIKKAYEQLKRTYDRLNKRTGEKNSPARTCKDLSLLRPELKSGEYWIDPNDGDKNDAILVYCDMPKKATCVKAQPQRSKNIQYDGHENEIWLSEVHNGMKITYKADSTQITHLQMLSTHATQNITHHCKRSKPFNSAAQNKSHGMLKLLAWNDAELTAKNSLQLRYEVVEDGCKVYFKDFFFNN